MDRSLTSASHWRERAEELRTIAERLETPARRNLIETADELLELAECAELAVRAEESFKVRT
jgi:hypothetical protein